MDVIKSNGFGWELEGDRIAVERDEQESMTPGGIIIPEVAKEKALKGTIIALGSEVIYDEQGLKKRNNPFFVGQRIQFGKYAGSEVTGDDGKEYLVMRVLDIMAYKP